MMPEKKRAQHQSGSGKGSVSQIQGNLCDKTADELLTELEAKMDEMTDLTYDEDVIDSYLDALDEKAPLEEDFDVKQSWEKFRSQHAILFDEDALPNPEVPQRKSHGFRFRKAFARVVVVAAIVALFSMFCAQAAGIDVFGVIGRWTEETFRFVTPTVSTSPASGPAGTIPDVEEYQTLQDAFDAYEISEQLAPTWYPDGYVPEYVEVTSMSDQIIFESCYSDGTNTIGFSYTYWANDDLVSSTFEKDNEAVQEYQKSGIIHYIMSNEDVKSVAWMNGTCECSMWGSLSTDDLQHIIDSIYC